MRATYPDFKIYDWGPCPACGGGLCVEARANTGDAIRYHSHCFACGKDETGIIRRVDENTVHGTWKYPECQGCKFYACCNGLDTLRPVIGDRYAEVCPHREEASE